MNCFIECYDIGGTQLRGVIIHNHEMISSPIIKETPRGDIDKLVDSICRISKEMRSSLQSTQEVDAVVIGLPGPVTGNYLECSPPLKLFSRINVVKKLSVFFKEDIFIENDLNIAARGEINKGEGKNIANFCLVTISTGIGVAAVFDGRVFDRKTELGHSILMPNKEAAFACGNHKGCWVAHASGLGVENLISREKLHTDVAGFFQNDNNRKFINEIRAINAQGIGNIINAYDPEGIIIMGSIGINQFNKIIPSSSELELYTINRPIPFIKKTKLGNNIGLWGAYYFGLENKIKCVEK